MRNVNEPVVTSSAPSGETLPEWVGVPEEWMRRHIANARETVRVSRRLAGKPALLVVWLDDERMRLRSQLERALQEIGAQHETLSRLQRDREEEISAAVSAERDKAQRELTQARECYRMDSARLDWLEAHAWEMTAAGGLVWSFGDHGGTDARGAIDRDAAALAEETGTPLPYPIAPTILARSPVSTPADSNSQSTINPNQTDSATPAGDTHG